MPRLARLYLKGNGASTASMIALGGGACMLASLDSLEELYLGLCVFVEYDGALARCARLHLIVHACI